MADLDALVASPWWQHMPLGWTAQMGGYPWKLGPVVHRDATHAWIACDYGSGWERVNLTDVRPVITDPATLGCLLALAREAWGDPYILCVPPMHGETWWGVASTKTLGQEGRVPCRGDTEAEALIAAILAAPPPGVSDVG